MTVKDALDDVEIAFRQLEFSIKLLSFCELGNITPSDFDTDHIVILGSERLNFPTGKFVDVDTIIKAACSSVLIAFSASVLALDDAFQAAGMKPCPEAVANDSQLRTLVYMARCAYAHGIATPRWKVRGKYCRTLSVNLGSTTISLDLPTLKVRTSWLPSSAAMPTGTASAPPRSACLLRYKHGPDIRCWQAADPSSAPPWGVERPNRGDTS
jgi:hypothetical protein